MNRTQPCQGKFTVSTENRTINITSLLYTRVADNDRFGERNVTVNDGVKNGLRRFFR